MLDRLPLDILLYVIELLRTKDLISLSRVNRRCHFVFTQYLYRVDPDHALAWGVYHGYKRTVQYSLDAGADPDGSSLFPVLTTVLERREKAASGGLCRGTPKQYDDIFWHLIERGSNPDLALGRGQPAIYEAARTGNEAVLRWAMNRKDAFDYKSYYLPDDIPKDILRPDSMFRQGILLHAAARSGSLAVIKLLVGLISVADVRTLNKDGASPLHVAVRYTGLEANLWEREAVVKLLMWRGPSRVHMKDKNGWTLFHSLAAGKITLNTEGPMVRMAEHLFALRVDINVTDNIGRTAMNVAEQLENNCLPPRLRFFGTLWEAMTDREPPNPWGVTPWQQSIAIAIRGKGQPKIFER